MRPDRDANKDAALPPSYHVPMAELKPGSRYFDYTIERLVGRGGFGAVYVARDRRLERRVALKILEPHLAADHTARRRFIDESRLAASLDYPNIAPIYEAGEEDEQLFLAMRYVPGPDLAQALERDGALEPIRAGRLVSQVASALDAAHAAGLVHRDVKPGNVLLAAGTDSTDHAYLTDFGLSKRVGGAGAVSQSQAGRFVGTVGYVAPEQIRGRTIDSRADVYSLGCLAYHALTGHQPYERDSEIGTIMAHAEDPPPSVHEALPDLADRVDPVIAKAMAKDPAGRYPSAGAFAAELASALSSRQPGANLTRGFLFADLRGYTAFVEEHGDEAAVRLLDAFRRLVRLVVAHYDGAEIKTEGDSFYVVFPSSSAAVQAGLGIIERAAAETERRPELPIAVGIGVHAGESSEWIEGYVGSSVNIAARLCAQAEPGEVLVSDTVRTLIRTSSKLEFVDRGQRTLKGIDEPMATWAALPAATSNTPAVPQRSATWHGPASGAPVRVAVAGLVVIALVAVGAWLLLDPGADAPPASAREMVAFSRFVPERSAGSTADEVPTLAPSACIDLPLDAKLLLADLDEPEAEPVRLSPATDLLELWPSWSADGSVMATIGRDQVDEPVLSVYDADGHRLVDPGPDALGENNGHPSLTDDGEFAVWKGSGLEGFYHVVATDGSSSVKHAAGADSGPRSNTEPRLTRIRTLPGDRLLSVWADGYFAIDDEPYTESFETMALDGTEPVSIGPSLLGERVAQVVVSPAGDQALVATIPSDREVGAVPLEWRLLSLDGDPTELTPLDLDAIEMGWSSDGARLYLVRADAPGVLIEHDLATGEERAILEIETGIICGPVARMTTPGAIGLPPAPVPGEPLPFERALLEPGRYRIDRFTPAMDVTFGSEWLGRSNYADGWGASPMAEPEMELSALQILVGLGGPCENDERVVIGSRPEEVVAWLSSREDLAVSEPIQVTVGGRTGISVDITPVPGTECRYSDDWNLYLSDDDVTWLEADEMLEITAVDESGKTIVFMKRAPQDRMEVLDELVDPVLESLEFVGGA